MKALPPLEIDERIVYGIVADLIQLAAISEVTGFWDIVHELTRDKL